MLVHPEWPSSGIAGFSITGFSRGGRVVAVVLAQATELVPVEGNTFKVASPERERHCFGFDERRQGRLRQRDPALALGEVALALVRGSARQPQPCRPGGERGDDGVERVVEAGAQVGVVAELEPRGGVEQRSDEGLALHRGHECC